MMKVKRAHCRVERLKIGQVMTTGIVPYGTLGPDSVVSSFSLPSAF